MENKSADKGRRQGWEGAEKEMDIGRDKGGAGRQVKKKRREAKRATERKTTGKETEKK